MESFAETVGPRLQAACDKLMAKGWPCPCIEVGAKVLGKHGLVLYAYGNLGGGREYRTLNLPWIGNEASMEGVLDDIDKAVGDAPSYETKESELTSALAKLTDAEKRALGLDMIEAQRTVEAMHRSKSARS
jgi:hypothetical protein